ncbi:hypothetical protein AB0B25_28035 [Nocardia sp. NPDC049190]|uniref:hypothetical protein n=1 Tax=Nocardia sp. NPDC049190 TaxID=3155650 RepID=UPI0033F28F2D
MARRSAPNWAIEAALAHPITRVWPPRVDADPVLVFADGDPGGHRIDDSAVPSRDDDIAGRQYVR